jgi:dephospho-CoA kinase
MQRNNVRIALTGGIACGKSTFSHILFKLGVATIDADDIVHGLESPGGKAVPLILKRFGESLLNRDGSINRPQLASIVFGSDEARRDLEAILFPMVGEEIDNFFKAPKPPEIKFSIAVIPLLFESHWESDYDIIVCVSSPRSIQVERMTSKRGYSEEHAEARLSAQIPVEEKAARSDYVVENCGSAEDLKQEARKLADWLKGR